MIEKLIEELNLKNEEQFRFVDLNESYTISVTLFDQAAEIPTHSHENDVFNYVLEGKAFFTVADREHCAAAGEWVHVSARKLHSLKVKEKTKILEFWRK